MEAGKKLTNLLVPGRPFGALASGRYLTKEANERIGHRAREGAHQQWPRVAPDITHAAPNVVRAAGRFPCASHG